ncbi:MAG TPA: 1-(5-phosphoribosyl)-5-[(5-phosphoribosylamino)methylideneamino]imidazole-4-carboxamide isomerase [Aliidiomarina sp.]|nr:1-(5-phosphoribosyl)-5-[(5-phosphoribosylamino)methylideneamino]imidazole-4-carboxamide isomerase [Aliidiomarina sp.]
MLIPALDLINGQVVRLINGDFNQQTTYHTDPIAIAIEYRNAGAEYLHLVDLDGARDPGKRQFELIGNITRATGLPIQVGGGIRSTADIEQLLAVGVQRVVIGSLAVTQPELVRQWFERFGAEAIVLALDVNINDKGERLLATHGWQQASSMSLETCLQGFLEVGCRHVLCTDISRDGTLTGSHVELYADLKQQFPMVQWQASGGVASLTELTALKAVQCDSVILGKALLTEQFTLTEALQCW